MPEHAFPSQRWCRLSGIGRYCLLQYIAVYRRYKHCVEGTMAKAKSTTLTFRIEPGLKEALRTAADRERHSIAEIWWKS